MSVGMRALLLIAVSAAAALGVLTVAALARPGQTAPAKTVQVFATFDVPGRTVANFTVTCPPRYIAMGGTVVRADPGVTAPKRWPLGLAQWVFRGVNGAQQTQQFTVVVTCVHQSQVPGFNVTSKTKSLSLSTLGGYKATISCPLYYTPTGAGYDLEPGEDPQRLAQTPPVIDVLVTTMRPVSGGWRFGLLNRGPAVRGKVLVRCIQRRRNGRSVQTARATTRIRLEPGAQSSFARRCPRSWSPLFAGWMSDSAHVKVEGYLARDKRARYRAENLSDEPVSLALDVHCARVG